MMKRDFLPLVTAAVLIPALLALSACNPFGSSSDDDDDVTGGGSGTGNGASSTYDVTIRRTKLGIPHIAATRNGDFGSVGYGLGYAFAEDNLCVLMEDLVTIRGERARFFGRNGINGRYDGYLIPANGSFAKNADSDFFWKLVATDAAIAPLKARAAAGQGEPKAATMGFREGFNRYIREIRAGEHAGRHLDCRNADWLQEITDDDLYRRYYRLALLASSSVFAQGIATAQPPNVPALPAGGGEGGVPTCAIFPILGEQCLPDLPLPLSAAASRKQPSKATMIAALKRDPGPLAAFLPENRDRFGSNMYALGPEATTSGVPMVFGNPHFPWSGTERLYISHLTIPGQGDIMGASLYGVPAILIGFNRHFAWSHTVSTAYRFTIYQLTLNPTNPTQYLYDGELRDMTAVPLTIQVKGEADESRTLYRTHYGPIIGLSTNTPAGAVNILPWTNAIAFTLRDANAENDRLITQFFEWNKATSLEQFKQLHRDILGVPWVNTVAAGPGNAEAYYGDVTVVPNVPDEMLTTCAAHPLHDVLQQIVPGLPVLDGSRADCEWRTDADAPVPGIFGPGNLPTQTRPDWVHNCNDSYWLTNPEAPLPKHASIIGDFETERSLRTRLCILQPQRHLGDAAFPAGAPNFDANNDKKFDLVELQNTVLSSYILSSELARASLLSTVCQSPTAITESGPVDIGEACEVLANWDQSGNRNAVGAHIWREFWRNAASNPVSSLLPNPLLWATPFSADDPVNTPRDVSPLYLPALQRALGLAVQAVQASGFKLDDPMENIQKSGVIGDSVIPIFGGEGHEGAFTIVSTGPLRESGYPVTYGNSYIQAVTWENVNGTSGDPVAEGFITYSQSTDAASPHFKDYTAEYSAKRWNRFPFTDSQITANQIGQTLHLTQ